MTAREPRGHGNAGNATWRALLALCRNGHALPRPFYTDPAVFELEMARLLLRHWFCAGHVSSLAQPGAYVVVNLGGESVIVVRDRDDSINALLNVCRHRGSRICTTSEGNAHAGRFTCPYHAWTYGLDGRLLVARQMPENFSTDGRGLRKLAVVVIEGLVFVSFADVPLGLSHVRLALGHAAGAYGWAAAKIAHRQSYHVEANWKLAVENYMECYHCQPAHPEYARRHAYARPAEANLELDQALAMRGRELGVDFPSVDHYGLAAAPGEEAADAMRSSLLNGAVTASPDGRPVAPLMGRFTDYDGGSTFFDVGPLSNFLAYPDHGVIYRFVPRSVASTDLEVIWLVRGDAVEGKDYDRTRLTWLWEVTSAEDKRIIELNQAGVSSRFFEPGPYSRQETHAQRFVEWYLKEVGDSA